MIVTYIFIVLVAGALFLSLQNNRQNTIEIDINKIDGIINKANERIEAIKNRNY